MSHTKIYKKRIVIKIGTESIITKEGLNEKRIISLAWQIRDMQNSFRQSPIIVTSGAIAAGKRKIRLEDLKDSNDININQAYASIGQPVLMNEYIKAFDYTGVTVGQFLLTAEDFDSKTKLENLRSTYKHFVKNKVVPIVNENDVIATEEIKFGDNDKLAALLTCSLDADVLLILSHIDGIYKNGKVVGYARSYKKENYDNMAISKEGRGGLQSKLNAAKIVNEAGKPCIISNADYDITSILFGKTKRTVFLPKNDDGWLR